MTRNQAFFIIFSLVLLFFGLTFVVALFDVEHPYGFLFSWLQVMAVGAIFLAFLGIVTGGVLVFMWTYDKLGDHEEEG